MVPGKTFHGRATFSWIESGAFLLCRSHIDEPEIPDGVAILGTDEATPDGQNIEAKGQMRRNGQAWEPDLQLTYSRVS